MKGRKWIVILIIVIIGVSAYYLYEFIKKKIKDKKDFEQMNQEQKQDAIMRDKYKTINNVDEFIESLKYSSNKRPFGYDVKIMASKKDKIKNFSIDYLQEIRDYIYNGLGENSEEENTKLLKFFDKVYK